MRGMGGPPVRWTALFINPCYFARAGRRDSILTLLASRPGGESVCFYVNTTANNDPYMPISIYIMYNLREGTLFMAFVL